MRREGFPKSERVRRGEEFTWILGEGKRLRGRFVSAYWIRGEGGESRAANRVGIAAGKKLGKAVLRNGLKRRIREAYRRNKGELPCRGIAIVFLASASMVGRSAADVDRDVTRLLRSIASSLG